MSESFEYNLSPEVVRYLANEVSNEIFGYTLCPVGGFVNLTLYDPTEIERCRSDYRRFMENAKKQGRLVYVKSETSLLKLTKSNDHQSYTLISIPILI